MHVHRLLTLGPENESLWVRHTGAVPTSAPCSAGKFPFDAPTLAFCPGSERS